MIRRLPACREGVVRPPLAVMRPVVLRVLRVVVPLTVKLLDARSFDVEMEPPVLIVPATDSVSKSPIMSPVAVRFPLTRTSPLTSSV